MQPPDELMTQVFLPSMRQLVALRLRAQGLSQNRISALLGLTQASVSIYLSSGRKKAYEGLAGLHVATDDADRYASRLSTALSIGPAAAVKELEEIWTDLLGDGSVCDAHRALHPSLAGCDFCIVAYGRRKDAREEAVAEVTKAVRVLEGSKEFAAVMPEVSVNVACAAGDSSAPSDVVAVPGRVVRVRGRAKAMLPPEAGASAHMARVLLLARSRRPALRACINLRYDRRMDGILRRAGMRTLTLTGAPRRRDEDPTVGALQRKLQDFRGEFDAVIDAGGGGIEPNVYLFAEGAKEAAELAVKLAEAYSAG